MTELTRSSTRSSLAGIVATAVVVAACSSATVAARQSELSPSEKARSDSALWPYTQADIQFMAGMISHHAQAIVMSRLAPTHDASPSLLILSARIINAQQDEIALMQQWLRERNQPVPEARPVPIKMVHDGVEHEMMMPGMLTDAQLKELEAAKGKEFDRLYLRYMIQHHQGAVLMVKELLGKRGAAMDETVFKLASDINVDQETEIKRMQQMLFALLIEKSSQ